MFYHTLSPFIWQFSENFGIRWYSLAYIIGFIATYFVLRHAARQGMIKNLTEEKVDSLILFIIIGVVVGARFFHVFVYEPAYYLANPGDILKIWLGGLSFHGGLVGCAIAVFLFARKNKVRFLEVSDLVVIPVAFFLMLGRIANFINGELYGTVTDLPWCVDYSKNVHLIDPPQGCRHPSQLYEAGKNLLIGLTMVFLHSREKKRKSEHFGTGYYTFLFLILYGTLRFLITFVRDEPGILGTGISVSQWLSLAMAAVGSVFMARGVRKRK